MEMTAKEKLMLLKQKAGQTQASTKFHRGLIDIPKLLRFNQKIRCIGIKFEGHPLDLVHFSRVTLNRESVRVKGGRDARLR